MTDPRTIAIADFTYSLADEKIARYPLPARDQSKLMVYREGAIIDDIFSNLPVHLPPGSLLVFNDSRVVAARILFQKESGGIIEIFCLEPGDQYPELVTAMRQTRNVTWKCLVGGASKWKRGQVLKKQVNNVSLEARFTGRQSDYFLVELNWTPAHLSFSEILHEAGTIPLPPYLGRKAEDSDFGRYQTIYAKDEGSVAAPTAGLHFTPAVFEEIEKKKINSAFVTLHVGAGTFKPVNSSYTGGHEMHSEWISVTLECLKKIRDAAGKIIPVGTTSLRTLESLYWLGVNVITRNEPGMVWQWQPYDQGANIETRKSLDALVKWMDAEKKETLLTQTSLIIVPGYRFRICEALVTNFHQPQSTLLLLVAAFIGSDWKNLYEHALEHDYRFLSYGDGSLLFRPGN